MYSGKSMGKVKSAVTIGNYFHIIYNMKIIYLDIQGILNFFFYQKLK